LLGLEDEQQAMPDLDSALDDDIGDEMLRSSHRLSPTAFHHTILHDRNWPELRHGAHIGARHPYVSRTAPSMMDSTPGIAN